MRNSSKTVKVLPVEKRWLSSAEAKAYLGMSSDFFDSLREEAMIHYYKVRGSIFYDIKDLDSLILNNRVI